MRTAGNLPVDFCIPNCVLRGCCHVTMEVALGHLKEVLNFSYDDCFKDINI